MPAGTRLKGDTLKLETYVALGSPAKIICSYEEFVEKKKKLFNESPRYSDEYVIGNITEEKKKQMIEDLSNKIGFVI